MTQTAHAGLGAFLRSRRERLTPEVVGLPERPRRRTPGLRREEVAELAGIGIDWYVRLEQGRVGRPSAATIDALAQALRLSPDETDHLRSLARAADRPPFVPERVPAVVRRIVAAMQEPAYVTGQRHDVLAWNQAACDILIDFAALPEPDRNILVFLFLDPVARVRFGDGWADQARRVLARFRKTYDAWLPDPAFVELADRLRAGSPQAATWWDAHDVLADASGTKTLHDPHGGARRFDHASFHLTDAPGLRLAVYTPA